MKAKRCAERSIATIREESERHLADWLKRPLGSITRNECAPEAPEAHRARRAHTPRTGRYSTSARSTNTAAPASGGAASEPDDCHHVQPHEAAAGACLNGQRCPSGDGASTPSPTPIRHDLQLFLLFTGLRSTDARTVRWEHVDFEKGTLHRPKPKGGEDRAFTVPVAEAVLDLLRRRRDENPLIYADDKGWVFPSTDMKGQVTHVRQARETGYDECGRKVRVLPSPHRLRDTFASAAHEARVHPLDLKVLMNHSLPAGDDVTEGYIRPSIEHLRGCVEQIATFLREKMGEGR